MAKSAGSQIVSTAHNFYDKAKPLAEKGFQMAKPYVKEYAPTLLGKAAEMIPIVGPIAGPIVKKGAEYGIKKLFGGGLTASKRK
jgi:hypothetical protein